MVNVLCCCLGVALLASAQQGPQPPPFEQVYRMPAVYSLPGMDKAKVHNDIVYKTVDTPKGKVEMKLDLYLPADMKKSASLPAVILISGGGVEASPFDWRDAGVYKSYGSILAASGFAGISFSKRYARGPEGTLRGIEDPRDLIGYVRGHAAKLSVDKDRLAFWGFSAGGLLLAPVLKDGAPYSRAVVCFYCVSDIDQDTWAGVGGVTEEGVAHARSEGSSVEQIHTASHALPPIFVGRAGLDSPELNGTIDKLVAEALAKNASIEVLNHPTGRHGFDIIDANERSREIIRRVLDFLRSNLAAR
jgi:acetyl esterase/lipase